MSQTAKQTNKLEEKKSINTKTKSSKSNLYKKTLKLHESKDQVRKLNEPVGEMRAHVNHSEAIQGR